MQLCKYAYMEVSIYAREHVCMCASMHVCKYACMQSKEWIQVCVYAMREGMYVCMHVCNVCNVCMYECNAMYVM